MNNITIKQVTFPGTFNGSWWISGLKNPGDRFHSYLWPDGQWRGRCTKADGYHGNAYYVTEAAAQAVLDKHDL